MAIPKAPVNRIIKRQTVKADDIALAIDKE